MAGGAVGCVPRYCLVVVIRGGGDAGPGGDVHGSLQGHRAPSSCRVPGLAWSRLRNAVAEKKGPQKGKTQAALSRNSCPLRVRASVRVLLNRDSRNW